MAVVKAAFPVLLRVTVRAALVVFRVWLPKVNILVEKLATGEVPTPAPVRAIICGLPLALSVMATEAVRLPEEAGVNVTLIVQLPPAATEAPQVLVAVKSPGLAPVTAMLAMFNDALPVSFRVTDCAELVVPRFWLPKARVLADRLAVGFVPVPVRLTGCGLPAALSEIITVAVRLPTPAGVKVTLIEHSAPAATEVPQVFVSGKSPGLAPDTVMLVMLKAALPLFVRVTVWAEVLVPTN
jgi:hypothetical protein